MCLVALAINQHDKFPFVLAGNRDEYFARQTSPLAWWRPGAGVEQILSGRDLEAGGTWLGLVRSGRFALLTNVRDPHGLRPDAPSRGLLVSSWLTGSDDPANFCHQHAAVPYNGFNLIAGNARTAEWFWVSNQAPSRTPLVTGIYGLSNAALDTPWPKTIALKARMARALEKPSNVALLAASLFSALSDRTIATPETLPSTGVPAAFEAQLSAAFVDIDSRAYGTRCSTVIVVEREGDSSVTHFFELTTGPSFSEAAGPWQDADFSVASLDAMPAMRHVVVDNWLGSRTI